MSRSPEFFRQLTDALGVGVATYGADGRFEYVNPAYATLLGMDRGTLEVTSVEVVDE